jgi:ketosteroid isomerase-like protein
MLIGSAGNDARPAGRTIFISQWTIDPRGGKKDRYFRERGHPTLAVPCAAHTGRATTGVKTAWTLDNGPRNPQGDTGMSDAIKAEIQKLEDRRFQAMIDSDFDTLDKLLGDDLIYTHSTAQSDTRAEYIALCKKGVFKYLKIERPIENIQVYGDTVVVTGHTKMDAIVQGKPKLLNSRYTNVWIKSAKGWQMVVWQSTPIPAPAA